MARARSLTDADRRTIAEARRDVDEEFHGVALGAAAEALLGRGEAYARVRRLLAHAHLPERLEASDDDARADEERAYWEDVARLVRLALDDAALAVLSSDLIHPKHVRELYRSLNAASPS